LFDQKLLAAGAKASAAHNQPRPLGKGVPQLGSFGRAPEPDYATVHTGRPTKALSIAEKAVAPEAILRAFNTWAFKREQPDNAARLLQTIAIATQLYRPIPFVLYWGKGSRNTLDTPDTKCLDYLCSLAHRVRKVYARGASFKLIFTDTHAILNGHSSDSIEQYFDSVEAAARERGFDSCWLSELVFAAETANAADASTDDSIPQDTLQKLGVCAAKWFRGEGTTEEGAERYYKMNMIEKQAVQLAFPCSIFVTFNGSEYRCLFPERMPIFYMYSLRRGFSVKPWFIAAEAQPASA
jgi:hypothetical protein